LDLVNAETEAQRAQALRQLEGALGALYDGWRSGVVDALATIEAVIDFPDEETPEAVPPGVWVGLREIEAAMAAHLADDRRGERVREGFRIAIVGAPNAGKSSLLNALARRDVAIVSDIPGTTRDAIEVRLDLGGFLVSLIDTAGLRESLDPVEREGVRRAEAAAAGADLVLEVVDARTGSGAREGWPGKVWRLWNKMDLVEGVPPEGAIGVSAVTGAGLDALGEMLRALVAAEGRGGEAPLTRERHRRAVMEARDALRRALGRREGALELAAEDVRLAARALGRITGRVDVEDVLDRLFAEFCIGK
jgi:tRNA modification GTPase